MPIAAPAATGPMAIAWNHIQLELIDRLGDEGLALARQLAMTTYRSEADFDGRFGREREADGRFSINSYLDHQGDKLVDRFDPDTYRTLVRVMDGHDVGRERGAVSRPPSPRSPLPTSGSPALGIQGDILYGPEQVRALLEAARLAGVDAPIARSASTKGHDAFLIEWDQLDPDPGRRAGRRPAPAGSPARCRGRRGGGGCGRRLRAVPLNKRERSGPLGRTYRLYRGRQARQPGEGPWTGTS